MIVFWNSRQKRCLSTLLKLKLVSGLLSYLESRAVVLTFPISRCGKRDKVNGCGPPDIPRYLLKVKAVKNVAGSFHSVEDSSFATTDSEPKPVLQEYLTVIVRAGGAVFASFHCRIFGPEFQLETQCCSPRYDIYNRSNGTCFPGPPANYSIILQIISNVR